MNLSVIIINWNSKKFLKTCLKSIKWIGNKNSEIIVVDNASFDGYDIMLKKHYPTVKFIQSKKNIGFAKANNLGVRASSGRNLLFLNPDTEVLGNAIEEMVRNLDEIKDAGAIGCKLLNSDHSIQSSSIQPFPTILNQLFDINFLKSKSRKLSLWGYRPLYFYKGSPEEVQVISGACILMKRKTFVEIGGFTEDYFMYAEDIDLCYKTTRAGLKNYYVGDVSIIHHGGGSSKDINKSYFASVLMKEAVFLFLNKYRGPLISNCYKISLAFSSIVRIILITLLNIVYWKKSLKITREKWKRILHWTVGLEKENLEHVSYK